MKLYYIWDAYCGWSYGFNHIFLPFMDKHPELDLDIISGGLFSGDNVRPLRDFQVAKTINQKIETYYHMSFGQAYNDLLDEGVGVMDSLVPARALSVFKKYLPADQLLAIAFDLQKLFFEQGLNLADSHSYQNLLDKYQLPADLLDDLETSLNKTDQGHPDFILAQEMSVSSYPTLILEHKGKFYNMIQGAQTAQDLENRLQDILTKQ